MGNGPYIAFHYRYEAGEWSSVCSKPQQGRKGEVCTVLEKTGSKGLALALARFILQTNAFLTGDKTQKHSGTLTKRKSTRLDSHSTEISVTRAATISFVVFL